MKRVLGVILLVVAIAMIVAGGVIGNNDKTYNKVLNKDTDTSKDSKTEDFSEIKKYVDQKYKDSFTVEKLLTTYNANSNDGISFYTASTNLNGNEKITIKVYKAKDKNNLYFYIKQVIHNEKNIDISKNPTIVTEGFYDNYLSSLVAQKYENEFLTKHKSKYSIKSLKIDGGLGTYKDNDSLLMSHYPKSDDLTNVSITAKELLNKISKEEFLGEFHKLNLVLEINSTLTKDNFQDEVKKFVEIKNLVLDNDLKIETLVLKYGTRTISEDYGIVLKENDKKIYDKNIVGYSGSIIVTDNTINYQDFIKLDKTKFNF